MTTTKRQLCIAAIFLLATVFQQANCLDLNFNNKKPQCFFMELKQGEKMLVEYEVTGHKSEQFKMSVYEDLTPRSQPIHVNNKEKKGSYLMEAPVESTKEYRICFESLDNSGKILQFEFVSHEKKADAYADDKALQQAFQESNEAYDLMNNIYTNLRHSLMKTEMQTKVLESTETKVKWCSVIKMALMISITAIQIIVLTGLFKDYSPLGI